MHRPVRTAALCLGLALCFAACHGAPPVAEASVKPGINAEYLDPDLDVAVWEKRFEGESREIFAQRAQITALLGLRAGMDVADVGAGTGLFSFRFAPAVAPGKVYAVDIAPRFVDHLRDLAARQHATNVVPVLCGERDVELSAGSVDLVYVCDTYHHFEYPQSTLASLFAALRPGGELVIVDFVREEGVSSPWILQHVRAGMDVVKREVTAVGFEFERQEPTPFLRENYLLRFRRP